MPAALEGPLSCVTQAVTAWLCQSKYAGSGDSKHNKISIKQAGNIMCMINSVQCHVLTWAGDCLDDYNFLKFKPVHLLHRMIPDRSPNGPGN